MEETCKQLLAGAHMYLPGPALLSMIVAEESEKGQVQMWQIIPLWFLLQICTNLQANPYMLHVVSPKTLKSAVKIHGEHAAEWNI